ncbi:acyltransferase family protein, partial [Chlamydia psittaci 84-8471/1]
MVMHFSTY